MLPTKEVVKFIKNNNCFEFTYKFDWHPSTFKSLVVKRPMIKSYVNAVLTLIYFQWSKSTSDK